MAFTKAFYQDNSGVALTNAFVAVQFPSRMDSVFICNDEASGANTIIVSFDGVTTHMVVKATEKFTLDKLSMSGMYLKYGTAAPAYRLMAVLSNR